MNANHAFAFETALALARELYLGWAPYAAHAAGAADIKEAFVRISSAMNAAMDFGVWPSLIYTSWSERIGWEIGLDGRAVVMVLHRDGPCILFDLTRGHAPEISFPAGVERAPHHIEIGSWIAEVLGCAHRYTEAIPHAEFRAWGEWATERGAYR